MRKRYILAVLLVFVFLFGPTDISAQEPGQSLLKVPQDFQTIQDAINAATNGDTVLVAPGTYMENINFRGKNIVVTSHFGLSGDVSFIKNTIINGSNPANPDTASCVLIVSGEDSSAVLQGFTLTGGRGTSWLDEHGAGTFVEGGGILITESSPTIQYNLIVDNEAIRSPEGTVSAGGGGMRCGDSSPRIYNNVIMNNRGMYGGAIVFNYCSDGRISNNIISGNSVYEATPGKPTFGGGGLWLLEGLLNGNDLPNLIINNTIISNASNSNGSGIRILDANTIVKNNIIWYNIQDDGKQINKTGTQIILEYNNIQNETEGTGNISLMPLFADSSFYVNFNSPGIDAGDPDALYNDIENELSAGNALWPSQGTIRNDMGAYGGPMALQFDDFSSSKQYVFSYEYNFLPTYPGESDILSIPILNIGSIKLQIDSVIVVNNKASVKALDDYPLTINLFEKHNILLQWTPQVMEDLSDTLLIYTNEKYVSEPNKIYLSGTSFPTAYLFVDEQESDLGVLNADSAVYDTIFYIYNYGTANDSVFISIDRDRVRPDSAMAVTPSSFEIGPKDSAAVTLSIYPSSIRRSAFTNIYKPLLIVNSEYSTLKNQFRKQLFFELSEATDIYGDSKIPEKFALFQNYPNPFNSISNFEYRTSKVGHVELSVYNILGQKVATLVNEEQPAGSYSVQWDAAGFASGIYYYKLNSGKFEALKKMVLIK